MSEIEKEIFQRTELLLGEKRMNEMAQVRVILFGVGGVGSWCAESLIRSGIKHLTIVDSDSVAASNINRQLMATTKTVGHVKVDELKLRLLEISPQAQIIALQQIYSAHTSDSFQLHSYHYIIDAIDSLANKADLIRAATNTKATVFSSMGAALKMDPMKIQVAEFWKVKGCPLGAALRSKIKKGELPAKKFLCVFSEEVLENKGVPIIIDKNKEISDDDWNAKKARINGTLVHMTAMFGFTLASLVVQDICRE